MEKQQLVKILQEKHIELRTGVGLYGAIIDRQLMSSSLQRVEEMREYQKELQSQSNHQEFKMSSSKCLSCQKVLSCTRKC